MPELWDEYHATFDSWFPTMCFPTDSVEEWNSKIRECLDAGQPAEVVFNLNYDENISY